MSCRATFDSMRHRPSISGAITFAALAAALLPAFLLAVSPLTGRWTALAVYLVAVTCCYGAWLAPSRRRRRGGLLFLAAGTAALLVLLPWSGAAALPALAIGCGLLIAIARSVLYYRLPPVRGLLLELALTVGGLLVAQLLAGPSLLSMAAALWGYLLVQSFYCLAPGLRVRSWKEEPGDPFDRASSRLRALLDGDVLQCSLFD